MGPVRNTIPRDKLRRLVGELLDLAAEEFERHSCNDFERPSYFTKEEWHRLAVEYQAWNSKGQDAPHPLGDWVLMSWMARLAKARELGDDLEIVRSKIGEARRLLDRATSAQGYGARSGLLIDVVRLLDEASK